MTKVHFLVLRDDIVSQKGPTLCLLCQDMIKPLETGDSAGNRTLCRILKLETSPLNCTQKLTETRCSAFQEQFYIAYIIIVLPGSD